MVENSTQSKKLVIGIDASNLRQGGGITHLIEMLSAADPESCGIMKVVVWSGSETLAQIEDQPWLIKTEPSELNLGLIKRLYWQRFKLAHCGRMEGCDLIFVPGGSISCSFNPIVTMSRNMLPFEWNELRRYGLSWTSTRLLLLRLTQSKSFRQANGVIFLTRFAKEHVQKVTGELPGLTTVIPHGLNLRFHMRPKKQHDISKYSSENPYRLLYVSIVDQYKHQWHVVNAVAELRNKGYPLFLDLVGPSYPPALHHLQETLYNLDPSESWVKYHGAVPYSNLHEIYAAANLGIFASSCENMPNILIETMAAGLPIACSNRGPMPEVLGDNGVYFDPEQPFDISKALQELIHSPRLRTEKANLNYLKAQRYSWKKCATNTFTFLGEVIDDYENSLPVS
jgi:glycosyltransferase involved in cell wall biosynthesis